MSGLTEFHKAERAESLDPAENVCKHCGDDIKHLPAGQGWVHADGYKLAPNAKTYTFVAASKITAASKQEAWDLWVEKLRDPLWLEDNTAVQP